MTDTITGAIGIQITRAGRPLVTDEAVELAIRGCRITIAAVEAPNAIPVSCPAADINVANDSEGDPRARVQFENHHGSLDTGTAAIFAQVAATAAKVAADIDAALRARTNA